MHPSYVYIHQTPIPKIPKDQMPMIPQRSPRVLHHLVKGIDVLSDLHKLLILQMKILHLGSVDQAEPGTKKLLGFVRSIA